MSGLPPYATAGQRVWYYSFRVICGLIFFFLIAPILVIIPLSFNSQDFFTFTPEMLALQPEGYSTKHYDDFFTNNAWQQALWNSVRIAPMATILSVAFGTLAAIGLSQPHVPFRRAIMAILISPMIVPLIISAAGMFFLVGVIYERTHTRDLDEMGGLFPLVPVYGGILIFTSMASLGLPGLNGFVSEFLVVRGAWDIFTTATIWSMLGLLFTGATAALTLKDAAAAKESFKTFMARMEEVAPQIPADHQGRINRGAYLEKTHAEDHPIYYVNILDDDFPFAPAWCVTDTHLMFSLFPQMLKASIRRGPDVHTSVVKNKGVTGHAGAVAMTYLNAKQALTPRSQLSCAWRI